MNRELLLERAARELLEQIDMLEGYQLSRDLPQHEAQADWDSAVSRLRKIMEPLKTREGWTHSDYIAQEAEWNMDEVRAAL